MPSRLSSALIFFALLPVTSQALAQNDANDAINPAAKSIAMAATLPAYDVVSIHQNKAEGNWSFQTTENGFICKDCPLAIILQFAYNLGNAELISGLSGPVDSVHFDIDAKLTPREGSAAAKFSDEQLQAMVIPVLAARFHLRVHVVPKKMTVYEIVVAKGGPKFKLTQPETDNGSANVGFSGNENTLTAKAIPIAGLADILSKSTLHTIVVDRTGLKGEADFTLKWTSDSAIQRGSSDAISIFTAIRDQLGLKLQSVKLPVDTLVVDHAEMPTEN